MATLTTINGRRIVQVLVRDRRRTISLGRIGADDARTIKAHVERLALAVDRGIPAPAETLQWAAKISDRYHAKLANIGLVTRRAARESLQLRSYFDAYIARRTDLKPRTISNLKQVEKFAVEHFGPTRDLSTITRGEVKDWRRALSARYADATVAMHVKKMRQLLADAQDRRLVDENPFRAVKAGSMSNPDRLHYVPRSDIAKVIEACPDHEWRLLFALARYAGLRVPSETWALRWRDVDVEHGRFTVRSSKTEHHAGKATRVVPIFPELMPRLLESQSMARPGAEFVFERLRLEPGAFHARAAQIIEKAGVRPWKKVFQNLRASCETDLATSHPMHVACAWIGNSTGVALKHYLQVKDEDYLNAASGAASAIRGGAAGKEKGPQDDAKIDAILRHFGIGYPLGDAKTGVAGAANTAKSLRQAHRALQKALHSTESYASRFRQRLISNLRQQVDQAKGRGGRR